MLNTRMVRLVEVTAIGIVFIQFAASAAAQNLHPSQDSHSTSPQSANRGSGPQHPQAAAASPPAAVVSLDGSGFESSRIRLPNEGQPRPAVNESGAPEELHAAAIAKPLDLEAALELTLNYQPDLVALRESLVVSAEALEVARRFPTSLNPQVSVDVLPWVFERQNAGGIERLETLVSVSWSQPVELGHRTGFRVALARATFDRTRWNILQAELSALVQTYRLHQTAVYRRRKLEVADRLEAFSRRLVDVLRRQTEAGQVPVADLVLAEVEYQAVSQSADAARLEYAAALAQLRQQIGIPAYAASAEPGGEFTLPDLGPLGNEDELISAALATRPEIYAARAQVANSHAAVSLARADRIPIPSIGPMYEKDESGVSFYGIVLSSPVPMWNTGKPLVAQMRAEHYRDYVALGQIQQLTIAQVKAALVKWNQTEQVARRTPERTAAIKSQSARMERLYEASQTDVVKLLQVQQRLIDAENAELESVWQATQTYADLLAAVGAAPLIGSLPIRDAAGNSPF